MADHPDPWAGLVAGNVDARRVNPEARQDFFWVVSGKAEPGLLLQVPPDMPAPASLPKMRNLDLAFRNVGGSRSVVLILKDGEQRELFRSLCLDIVSAAEVASDSAEAVQRMVRRTMRWHHLLRGGRSDLLSTEEQRGLVGELWFLRHLIDVIGSFAAIEAWKGPAGGAKDFEIDRCLVEVKARRGAAKPYVQISSEDQLSDVEGCRLFLAVAAVDAAIKPQGQSLNDLVLELERNFSGAEPEAHHLWELAVAEAGFDFEHDYSDRRWTVGKALMFEVMEGFPRIVPPLCPGVSRVRYSIALEACAPFAIDPALIDAALVEETGDE